MGPSQGRHSSLNAVRILARSKVAERGRDRRHHGAPAHRAGHHGPSRGPQLRAGALHGDALPPSGGRRHHDAGGALAPARVLWRQGQAPGADPGGGQERPRQRGHHRCLHPRRARRAWAGRGRVHEPHVHLRLPQAAGGPLALRADDRPRRRGGGRRRRLPHARGPLLRHGDDLGRRQRLPRDALVQRPVAAQGRRDQRHRRARGRQHRGPQLPPGAGIALRRRRPLARGLPLHGRARGPCRRHPHDLSQGRLRRRARLRAARAGEPGRGALGRADGGRQEPRHPALRRRGAAPAQAGEGPHPHRPGHRRPHHPPRGRHGLGARQEEALPRRHPLGADAGGEGAHPQAGGLRDAGRRRGAAEGVPPGDPRRARSPGGSPRSPIRRTSTRSSASPTSRPTRASPAPRSRSGWTVRAW